MYIWIQGFWVIYIKIQRHYARRGDVTDNKRGQDSRRVLMRGVGGAMAAGAAPMVCDEILRGRDGAGRGGGPAARGSISGGVL